MARPIAVDAALWPLLRVEHRASASERQYRRLFDPPKRFPRAQSPFAVLVYGPGEPDAEARRAISLGLRQRREDIERFCVGMAVVIDTPGQRSALTAIHWSCQPDAPFAPFSTYAGALEWCLERLEGRSVAIPRAIQHHLEQTLHTRSTLPPEPESAG